MPWVLRPMMLLRWLEASRMSRLRFTSQAIETNANQMVTGNHASKMNWMKSGVLSAVRWASPIALISIAHSNR